MNSITTVSVYPSISPENWCEPFSVGRIFYVGQRKYSLSRPMNGNTMSRVLRCVHTYYTLRTHKVGRLFISCLSSYQFIHSFSTIPYDGHMQETNTYWRCMCKIWPTNTMIYGSRHRLQWSIYIKRIACLLLKSSSQLKLLSQRKFNVLKCLHKTDTVSVLHETNQCVVWRKMCQVTRHGVFRHE